jgi:hypothetical protein
MIVCDERQKHKRGGKEKKSKNERHEIRMPCGGQNVNYTNPFVGTRHEVRLANEPVGVTIQCHLTAKQRDLDLMQPQKAALP